MIISAPFCAAASASLFQFNSRSSSTSLALASLSKYCLWHSSNNSASISRNIFLTFTVNPFTAGFQWLWTFFSNASNIMGNTTVLFWAIKLTMCSLFHKKRARSATYNIDVNKHTRDNLTRNNKWNRVYFIFKIKKKQVNSKQSGFPIQFSMLIITWEIRFPKNNVCTRNFQTRPYSMEWLKTLFDPQD